MKVCICGGGNIGHVIAGFLSSQAVCEVLLLTRNPNRWQSEITIETPDGNKLKGTINQISSDPAVLIPQADIVLFCLPGFSIREELIYIKPYIKPDTFVGSVVSSTGFFFEAMEILPSNIPLFGFQRVPFISRIIEYGQSAKLMGYKSALNIAIERTNNKEFLRALLEKLFVTPTFLMQNFYEVSLSNSNPLLHPSRLYTLWKNWHKGVIYPICPMFYEDWTNEASQLLIEMDEEFNRLLGSLPVRKNSIPTILDYYDSTDAESLTRKLRSIQAFKGIPAAMMEVEGGYVPDFTSRYFTEDFPFGLRIISKIASKNGISTPLINKVLTWGLNLVNTNYE